MTHEPLITIVDDDASVREAVQALLQSTGRRAVTFESAEQFLASEAVRAADCLILDLWMPGIGGLELQQRMLTAGYRIPTIVLTAHTDDVSRARALAAGAAAFLPKPFRPEILLEAVEASLRSQADVSDDESRNS
jgi:FixJ family two-component response regulator